MRDGVFRALADPTRRRILELLADDDLTAGEIASHFNMAFPSVSHHLGVLRDAELVATEREGQFIRYRLNSTVFQDALRYLMQTFGGKRRG